MRRGMVTTALVAGLAMAATACGGGGGGDQQSGGELSGTVTFWDTSNDAEKATYRKLAEAFEKEHPKVDVKYVSVPFGDANAKFKNAAGGGAGAPDVMRTEVAWVADFANLGYLAPLDDTPALDNPDDYLPQAFGSTKFKDKTYAVPQVIDTLGLFYNKRLLKEAGVEVPKTFAELTAAAKQIKDKTGATALYLRGDDPYWFMPYLYGEGGDMVDARDKVVTIDDDAGVKAFRTIKDLVDSKAAVTDATDGQENQLKALKDGNVAMAISGPWDIEGVRAGKEFKDRKNLASRPCPAAAPPRVPRRAAGTSPSTPLEEPPGLLRLREVHELGEGAAADHREAEPAAHPQVGVRDPVRQGQRDGRLLQARRRQGRPAPVDRPGQLPLRADQGPDEQGPHRRRHPRAGRQAVGDSYRKLLKDYK